MNILKLDCWVVKNQSRRTRMPQKKCSKNQRVQQEEKAKALMPNDVDIDDKHINAMIEQV